MISRANATPFGLAGSSHKISPAHRVIDQIDAGTCYINCYNIALVEALPGAQPWWGVKTLLRRSTIIRRSRRFMWA